VSVARRAGNLGQDVIDNGVETDRCHEQRNHREREKQRAEDDEKPVAALQRIGADRKPYAKGVIHVVKRTAGRELIQEPDSLLRV